MKQGIAATPFTSGIEETDMHMADQQFKQQYHTGPLGGVSGGLISANIGNQAMAEQRQRELPAALDSMERAANYLHDSVNELSSRLDGVLRAATPEPTAVGQVQLAPPSSGYASSLHGQAARVSMLADRIQELLRRLEV